LKTEDIKVAILGAGFSGLGMGIKLKEAGFQHFTIYEKADDVGGTWRANTYPGCGVDIAAPLYSYSFELKKDWTRSFAKQPEILEYIKHCTRKYKLESHLKLNTEIVETRFNEDDNLWYLKDNEGNEYSANILVSGVGGLHQIKWPNIPGRDKFKGINFHTARWEHEHSLKGKTVGIIGNGCSAVQVIPTIAPDVKKLIMFFRSPKWLAPKELLDKVYSKRRLWIYKNIPFAMHIVRFIWFLYQELFFKATIRRSRRSKFARKLLTQDMQMKIHDKDRQELLIPKFSPLCSRVTPSDNYLQALERKNVDIVTEKLESVEEKGLRTSDGKIHELDILIYATGFDVEHPFGPLKMYGRSGTEIMEFMEPRPKMYYGITAPHFPNFFMFLGPNTALAHNSVLIMIEAQIRYAVKTIKQMVKTNSKIFEVKESATELYDQELHKGFVGKVWHEGCSTFYKNDAGDIIALWPKSAYAYIKEMRHPVFTDYEFS